MQHATQFGPNRSPALLLNKAFVPGSKHEPLQLTVNLSYKRRHIDLPAHKRKHQSCR